MVSKVKFIYVAMVVGLILLCISFSYAEIDKVEISDIKDHQGIVRELNRIINKLNKDKVQDAETVDFLKNKIAEVKNDSQADIKELKKTIKYQIGLDDKVVRKMVTKGWISTHAEVEP